MIMLLITNNIAVKEATGMQEQLDYGITCGWKEGG